MKRLFFFLLFFLGIFSISQAQTRWYVDINGWSSSPGTSWSTACNDLQLVINNASSGDTIWVAQGTYYPIRPADNLGVVDYNNRDNAFVLKANVHIYGGFIGSETALSQRNWNNNPTILSGDIGILNDSTDNCYHVVISAGNVGTACLDGFTITKGLAHGETTGHIIINTRMIDRWYGGGILNDFSSPILSNLTITNNTATDGGGIHNTISSPILANVIISNNVAISFGGGMRNEVSSSPILINVVICKNVADASGGGIFNSSAASPILTNVTISNNLTSFSGGGICNENISTLVIRNTVIWGNTSQANTGHNIHNATTTSTVTYSHCLIGCEPIGNGIILNGDPLFEDAANGDYRLSSKSPCINTGSNSFYHPDSTPDISLITVDLDNNPRFYNNGIVDLGAYEYQGNPLHITPNAQGIIYVNKHVSGGNGSGNSWTNAVKELADALYAAKTNTSIQQIWVAQGTYYPLYQVADDLCDTSLTDRDKSFLLVKDIQVYGGFVGNETSISQRIFPSLGNNGNTILSGDIGITGDTIDNCYHVVISAGDVGTACLDGFTVAYGNTNHLPYSIEVNHELIEGQSGGGIYVIKSCPLLINLIIENNFSGWFGGGIYNTDADLYLENVLIEKNTSAAHGGGIYNRGNNNNFTMINVAIRKNTAIMGGGICDMGKTSFFTNVIIVDNYTSNFGGGIFMDIFSYIFTNVTIANNYASDGGGGIFDNVYGYSSNIRNSIIWGNTSGNNIVDNISIYNSNPSYSHCLIGGQPIGNGIILNSDPLFLDAANGDYRLTRNSPCFNAGDNSFYSPDSIPNLSGITIDLDGNPRISQNVIDLGAYEYQLNIIPDNNGIVYVNKHVTTGNGTGNSWYNAAIELADALYFASLDTNIKQIWVAEGTYYPLYNTAYTAPKQLSTDERDKTFLLVKNVQIYGGFPINANDIDHITIYTRDWNVNSVILSGDIGAVGDNSDNCFHVVVSAGNIGNACLDGLTIQDGKAIGTHFVQYLSTIVHHSEGGGIHAVQSSLTLKNVELKNNKGKYGGGIFWLENSSVIYNTSFIENEAEEGGGMYTYSQSNGDSYVNCLFLRNKSTNVGGSIYYDGGSGFAPVFTNCTFTGDSSNYGNLIYYHNIATQTALQFRNCIIDSLPTGTMFDGTGATIDDIIFSYCITPYASLGNNPLNTGNILATDPMFLNRNTDDYRLNPNSSAVNAGYDYYYLPLQTPDISSVTTDLAGRPRFNSASVDMGAHEHQVIIEDNNGIVYVNKHVVGGNGNGNSWTNAAKELADALYAAKTNTNIEQIWVAQATYTPFNSAEDGILGNGKRDNAFVLGEDIRLYGGFPTSANDIQHNTLSSRNWKLHPATLSGVIGKTGTSDDTVCHVVISAGDVGDASLDGFIITNGNASENKTILVNGNAVSHQDGGGMYVQNSSPSLSNLNIKNNITINFGGGIFSNNSSHTLINTIISSNTANVKGGGIFNQNSSSVLTNVLICNNSCPSPSHFNIRGGGMYNFQSSPILTNTTIVENYASEAGGGICNDASSPIIRNSILWKNISKGHVIDNVENNSSNPAYSHCLIEGEALGDGIILNSDPLFAGLTNHDYRLTSCSPAIDAGNNDFYSLDSIPDLSTITTDLDNNFRFYNNGIIDLGAYEYHGNHVIPPSVTIEKDTIICYGESADVTFTIAGGSIWDIIYTKDNGITFDTLKNITASSHILTDDYTESTTYKLQSISNHVCDEISLFDEITITVLPEATLDTPLTNDTLCDGQQTKSVHFYGTADQFQWAASEGVQGLPPGTQTGDFKNYTVENKTSSPTTSVIKIIPVSTQGGVKCEGSAHSFNIIASPATTIQSFTSNKSIFCEGEELEMVISATGYLLSYQWFFNGSALNGQTRNTYNVPKPSSSQTGQYYVKIKSYCGEQTSNSIMIRIDKDSVLVEKWDDVLLVDNSSEDYIGYQWYKDGIMIPGATNQFYQELGGLNGCYKVNLTLKGGKREMTCERCLDNVIKSLSIYPNPVKQGESVHISLYDENQLYEGLMETRLYSVDGKLVQKKQTYSGNSEINMSNFAIGIYILKITTEDGQQYNEKIMVY